MLLQALSSFRSLLLLSVPLLPPPLLPPSSALLNRPPLPPPTSASLPSNLLPPRPLVPMRLVIQKSLISSAFETNPRKKGNRKKKLQLTPALTDFKGPTIFICYRWIFVFFAIIEIKEKLFKELKNIFC